MLPQLPGFGERQSDAGVKSLQAGKTAGSDRPKARLDGSPTNRQNVSSGGRVLFSQRSTPLITFLLMVEPMVQPFFCTCLVDKNFG